MNNGLYRKLFYLSSYIWYVYHLYYLSITYSTKGIAWRSILFHKTIKTTMKCYLCHNHYVMPCYIIWYTGNKLLVIILSSCKGWAGNMTYSSYIARLCFEGAVHTPLEERGTAATLLVACDKVADCLI